VFSGSIWLKNGFWKVKKRDFRNHEKTRFLTGFQKFAHCFPKLFFHGFFEKWPFFCHFFSGFFHFRSDFFWFFLKKVEKVLLWWFTVSGGQKEVFFPGTPKWPKKGQKWVIFGHFWAIFDPFWDPIIVQNGSKSGFFRVFSKKWPFFDHFWPFLTGFDRFGQVRTGFSREIRKIPLFRQQKWFCGRFRVIFGYFGQNLSKPVKNGSFLRKNTVFGHPREPV